QGQGLFKIDRLDAGVRVGAAQDPAIEHAGLREIGAKGRPAGDLLDTIGPDGALTDPLVVRRTVCRHASSSMLWRPHLERACGREMVSADRNKSHTHSGRTDLYAIRKRAAG